MHWFTQPWRTLDSHFSEISRFFKIFQDHEPKLIYIWIEKYSEFDFQTNISQWLRVTVIDYWQIDTDLGSYGNCNTTMWSKCNWMERKHREMVAALRRTYSSDKLKSMRHYFYGFFFSPLCMNRESFSLNTRPEIN